MSRVMAIPRSTHAHPYCCPYHLLIIGGGRERKQRKRMEGREWSEHADMTM